METPKTISDKLIVTIPLNQASGESMETAIQINCPHINYLIPIQNKIIHYIFDDEPWTKVGQSLYIVNEKKYDKIEVVRLLLEDGETKRYEFWFDITGCYE